MGDLVESAESENVTLSRAFANTIWPRFSSYVMSISRADGDALRARSETLMEKPFVDPKKTLARAA